MADTEKPSEDTLESIARQIGEWLPESKQENTFLGIREVTAPTPKAKLKETLAVYTLEVKAIQSDNGTASDLSSLAQPTNSWHHQVKQSDGSHAFARSSTDDKSGQHSLDELFYGTLAEKIDKAISWADAHVPDTMLARLLLVPSYRVEALWFFPKECHENEAAGDEIYVMTAPQSFTKLAPDNLYSARDFLEALRHEKPVGGFKS